MMKDLKPGDTVNHRYQVVRKLGAGAMGSVYLCEDIVENNIQVALKVLISENLEDQDVWAKGEYETLTRLRHPNLARVYNFGKIHDSTDYFIVSEFIKGIDLFSATEYVNYEELTDIVVQTCRALDYIHSKGYVHFDIKPDNILVTRYKTFGLKEGSKVQYKEEDISEQNRSVYSKPNVKLIDFGLAERITGSFSFAIKGTLNYLAPEIISGKTPDRRADLYSLGVTLYQITNRDLPHQNEESEMQHPGIASMRRSELFEYHMKKHPEYLRVTIMKLLEENPDNRFQSAGEVIHYLSKNSGRQYEVETKETQKSYLHSTRMVGRKKEMHALKSIFERIFNPENPASSASGADGENGAGQEPEASTSEPSAEQTARGGDVPSTLGRSTDLPIQVLVSGEIGIGKTRLIEEFQHFLRLNDVHLYSGNCYEGITNAYQPFVEILRQMVYGLGLGSDLCKRYRAGLSLLLPEMHGEAQTLPTDVSFEPDQEKIFFIDRISHFLIESAKIRPYVIFINNLHWADEASVDLLEAIVDQIDEHNRRKGHLKSLIVSSLRIDEQYLESLKSFLGGEKNSRRSHELFIRRLKRSQIVELLQSMLGFTEIFPAFLDRLEEKTGGNPLFIQETLKALQDEGILRNTVSGWQIKTNAYNRVEIPHSLEELILNRIRKLEAVKREILEVMSVLNRPISPKVLQKFKRFSAIPILVHVRDLEDSGLLNKVFEGGKLTFQIDQPKMREIIYSSLEEGRRKKYHGEVAEVFADIYRGHEEEILEDLAYHYQRSDLTERALAMAVKAGDRLMAIYANDRALEFYLYIIDKIQADASRVELWMKTQEKVGDLCSIMGKYDLAEQSYDSLLNFEDDSGLLSPRDLSRFYRKKGKLFEIQGDYDTALRCYKDARNHLAEFEDPSLQDEQIRVFNCIGWVYVCMGKYEKAMAISTEGLRVIEGMSEKIEHAMIYRTIGSANYYKGSFAQAIEFHTRSLKIQENLENIPEITVCVNNLGRAYMANADYAESLDHFRRALQNSEDIGDPHGKAVSLYNMGCLFSELGQLDKAEAYVADSLQLSRSYNMRFLNIENYIIYGKILREKQDYSRAESYLFRALTAYSKQGNRWGLCTILLDIVSIHRLRGNYAEALSMVEEAFRYASDLDIHLLMSRCLLEKGKILKDSGEGDQESLVGIFEDALKTTAKMECPELLADIYQEIGDLYVKSRKLGEAKERYRLAEEQIREVLERLPREFQDSYRQKHKDNFLFSRSDETPAPPVPDSDLEPPEVVAEEASPVTLREGRPPLWAELDSRPGKHAEAATDALESMNELMQAIQNSPSLESFLQLVLKRLIEISRAKVALILARNDPGVVVRASLFESQRKGVSVESLVVMRLIQKTLQTRSPMAVSDMVRDSRIGELGNLIKAGFRSLLVVPYQSSDEEGVLYLLDPVPRGPRLQDDVAIYTFFTNLLPLAFLHLTSPTAEPAEMATRDPGS